MAKLIDRRQFAAGAVAAGVSSRALKGDALASPTEQLRLKPNGWVPNNVLPVILYRRAVPLKGDVAASMEALFTANGWPPQWRNGLYPFHHFHSTAHEVLGFAAGDARLMLGGEGGEAITVRAGDVAVLPAGSGHCRISASDDFLVIGAYPPDEHWDICRTALSFEALERMKHVRYPDSDPVQGKAGILTRLWT